MISEDRRAYMHERRAQRFRHGMGKNRLWTGLVLVIVGAIALLQKISAPFPAWLFTWPVLLIIFGVFIAIRKKFRGPGWLMMIAVGTVFLAGDLYPEWNIRAYSGPILIIAAGLAFILRPRHHKFGDGFGSCDYPDHEKKKFFRQGDQSVENEPAYDDLLEVTSVLSGTKKIIMSKDFKGGEVTSFLGGTELNLSQAEISGRVVLELTQVFGGTKLIVPSHWDIKPELVSVFGGIEDKRQLPATIDPTKILVLKGTSVFGGIEIRSF